MGIVDKVGKFILNRGFGVMTKRQGQAAILKSGRALFETAQKGEQLTAGVVSSIFAAKLPKGVAIPPVITSAEGLTKFISDNLSGKAAEILNSRVNQFGAAYLTMGKNGVFYFPSTMLTSNEAFVVGATHELTHFVDFKGTKVLSKFLSKLVPNPIKSFATLFFKRPQQAYQDIQARLISDLGLEAGLTGHLPASFMKNMSSKKVISYFRRYIREKVKDFSPIERRMFFGLVEKLNSSEVSAYTNSGRVGRLFGILGQDRVHSSELIGKYQELFVQALKKERQAFKIARKSGLNGTKVPKRKYRTAQDYVEDKSGNMHRKTIRYSSEYRQNPTPVCVENIRKNMHSQGENLYKISKKNYNVISEEVVRLDDVQAAGGKAARKVLHSNGLGLKS